MIEDAQVIFNYLPVSYKNPSDQTYINFLWDTFTVNYEAEKYSFAFLAYHMLFMCFVYFEIWQIKENRSDDFKKAMVGFNKEIEKTLLEASSPFTLCCINESIVFRFLKLIDFDNSDIGCFTKIVKDRNDLAHSNGKIFYESKGELDTAIDEILICICKIQQMTKNSIVFIFKDFLLTSSDQETREYFDSEDQVTEILIHKNYLSLEDIKFALECEIHPFYQDPNFSEITNLVNVLLTNYGELMYG